MGFLPAYIKLADRAEVYDNSGNGLVSILTKRDGRIMMSDDALKFDWVKKYLSEFL